MTFPHTRFSILGPLEVAVDGRPVHMGGPKVQTVLAALLLADQRVVTVDRLVDHVWGDDPPASARNLVQTAVWHLRQALLQAGGDAGLIETAGPGYRLRAEHLDSRQAEVNLDLARQAEPDRAVTLLRETLALWRGPVLPGIESPALRAAASPWEELRLKVMEDWAELELELGRHRELVGELGAFVADHPLRERARGQLMLALFRSGRQAESLQIYEHGRAVLDRELGLEPGQALREVRDAILRDEPAVRRRAAASPAQLPPLVSAFTGRGRELDALDALLDHEEGARELPLCVVHGFAGVGKTGLAVTWAHRVAGRFPNGQLFANLRGHDRQASPLRPEAVLARFLRALGVPGERIPAGLDERTALFRSMLEGRRVLILLDNAASAAQVRPLLPGAAPSCVVVTSRSRLSGLVVQEGARSIGLDLLTAEEAEEMLARVVGDARLSRERAAARRLVQLCDRLPLALRIAAAKLISRGSWTVAGMADRLQSERGRLDELHQDEIEVRGSFTLSYRDLPQVAKLAFRRLGLLDLPGGFAAWTVAALVDVPLPEAEELCEQLVDAQLAQPLGSDVAGQSRYGFHDLIRLFSRERAHAEEDQDTRAAVIVRAMSCLLFLVEQARQREGRGPGELTLRGGAPRWQPVSAAVDPLPGDHIAWMDAERSTIVAAVEQCAMLGLTEMAWELTAMAVFSFEQRAAYDDWLTAAGTTLRACQAGGNRRGAAAMEFALGMRLVHMRRLCEAAEPLGRAIAEFESIGDKHGLGLALRYRASLRQSQGQAEECLADLDRALILLREVGDRLGQAMALLIIGQLQIQESRLDEAQDAILEAAALIPAADRTMRAGALKRLADVFLAQGRYAEARTACEEALELVRAVDDQVGEAFVQLALSKCLTREGDTAAGDAVLSSALKTAREMNDPLLEGRVLLAMGQYGEASDVFARVGAHAWHAKAIAELARR